MELENYLRDLQNWEKDIHKKDQELIAVEKGTKPNWKRKVRSILLKSKSKKLFCNITLFCLASNYIMLANWLYSQGIPPPRGTKKSLIEAVDDSSSKHEPLKEKSKKIASYDYAAWDKFNVVSTVSFMFCTKNGR